MSRVNLLLAGAQKCGTSTLHALMSQLRGLAPPIDKKELHFFDNEQLDWQKPDYSLLHASFKGRDPRETWFESTPITLYWPPCLQRVHAYNPDMKLIFIFRDPVLRAYSHWAMQWSRGVEKLPFSEALLVELSQGDVRAEVDKRKKSYLQRGLYAKQLDRAFKLFDPEQVLLLSFDDLVRDPGAVLRQVAYFAGAIMPAKPELNLHLNARASADFPAPLQEADIALLVEHLAEDTARFAAMSRLDVSDWLSAKPAPARTA